MERRHAELSELKTYLIKIDKEVTMVLQSLQWDRKHLLEGEDVETCSINSHHKVPHSKKQDHQRECVHTWNGYSRDVQMLPEAADVNAATLVTFSTDKIHEIIENAARSDPRFTKGHGHNGTTEPLTLDRLQSSYTPDERRAIHDAVVAAAPEHDDLADLPLASVEERKAERAKSKLQVLSELRDQRRRRAKYRVANNTRNYSDVLRGLISSQMEMFTQVKKETEIIENDSVQAGKSDLTKKDKGHNSNEKRIETSRYEDPRHNIGEREAAARERYKRKDSTRRDDRDRRYEKNDRTGRNSCTTSKDTSRVKHYVKEYSDRKTDKRRERDKLDYRKDKNYSSKHEYYKQEKDETVEKYNIKYDHHRDYHHNDHENVHNKHKTVQVKKERDSVSPGSSKDWKSYKEHVKRSEESRSYEDYKFKRHESREDYKRKGDKLERYYEHDTDEDKKHHKKHYVDKYLD